MPNVQCPSCRLSSYVAAPHSGRALCPHCDADLSAAVVRPAQEPPASGVSTGDLSRSWMS